MKTKVLAAALLMALIATACQSSIEVGSSTDATQTPERQEISAVEPTAVPQDDPTEAAPTVTPAVVPTTATESAIESPMPDDGAVDPDLVVFSGRTPPRRLCTTDVDFGEELNLRSSPSLDAAIVFGIPAFTCRMIAVGDGDDGWVEVVYETQNISLRGYVSTDFAQEQPFGTVALRWVDRMLAGEETSGIVYQPFMDASFALHPFPAGGFFAVSFDDGTIDCKPQGDTSVGCAVWVRDELTNFVSAMVVTVAVVGFDGYGQEFFPDDFGDEPLVTGFELCRGPESCDDFDFSRHGRIVVDGSQSLAGVPLGTPAEQAIVELTAAFGDPTSDTGWVVGCPLDDPDLVNERYVQWGSLEAGFRGPGPDLALGTFDYWSYWLNADRTADADGPQPSEVELPSGAAMGMNITLAADALNTEQFENELLQTQQLTTESWNLYGAGLETSTRINAIGVPFIPICD